MLILFADLVRKYGIKNGKILHIGAHKCEEKEAYEKEGFSEAKVIWIEGNSDLVNENKQKYPNLNIIQAIISDEDGKEFEFIITNNGESSSILELDEHLKEHPTVHEIARRKVVSKTVDTIFKENNFNAEEIEFVNIDIQGAELMALKGAKSILYYANYFYIEINEKSLYKGCPLLPELDIFMLSYGFRRVETSVTQYGWGDALYKKDSFNYYVNNVNAKTNGELAIWKRLKPECKVIFDVGARTDLDYVECGLTSYLFEPNPTFYEEIKKKLSTMDFDGDDDTNIEVHNFGLGEEESIIRYYQESQSFHFRNVCKDTIENSTLLKIRKLDNFVKDNSINNIDFIKIDTEGHEWFVLKGAKESLPRIKYIQFEYGGTYLDCGKRLEDVYILLRQSGFKYIYLIVPSGLMGQSNSIEHLQYSNYLASKTAL